MKLLNKKLASLACFLSLALITCWFVVSPVCHAGEAEQLQVRKDRVNRRVVDWQRWANDWNSRCSQTIIDSPAGNRCAKERSTLRAEKAAIQAEVAAVEAAMDKYNRSRKQQALSSNAGKELKSARDHSSIAAEESKAHTSNAKLTSSSGGSAFSDLQATENSSNQAEAHAKAGEQEYKDAKEAAHFTAGSGNKLAFQKTDFIEVDRPPAVDEKFKDNPEIRAFEVERLSAVADRKKAEAEVEQIKAALAKPGADKGHLQVQLSEASNKVTASASRENAARINEEEKARKLSFNEPKLK